MFTFELAYRLGMTRRQLLSKIDSAELSEWAAFFRLRGGTATEADIEGDLMKVFGNPATKAKHRVH